MPENAEIAPAVTIAALPPIAPQAAQPAVTSKNPAKIALYRGEVQICVKKYPCSQTPRAPQAIIIKAHILKQLSAAELTDSIMQAELLLRGGALSKDGGAFLQKKAPDAAITAPENYHSADEPGRFPARKRAVQKKA